MNAQLDADRIEWLPGKPSQDAEVIGVTFHFRNDLQSRKIALVTLIVVTKRDA